MLKMFFLHFSSDERLWTQTLLIHPAAGDSMPIGGVVITVRPDDRQDTEVVLTRFPELSVYGCDEKGNIIGMLKGRNSRLIEEAVRAIEAIDTVLEVNLVDLNPEDPSSVLSHNK